MGRGSIAISINQVDGVVPPLPMAPRQGKRNKVVRGMEVNMIRKKITAGGKMITMTFTAVML